MNYTRWMPREQHWDLYVAVCHALIQGTRTSIIYQSGPPQHVTSYQPIAVSTGMYGVLACLVLNNLRNPTAATLSTHKVR